MTTDWRAHLATLPDNQARALYLQGAAPLAPDTERHAMRSAWLDVIHAALESLCRRTGIPTIDPAADDLETHEDPWAAGY